MNSNTNRESDKFMLRFPDGMRDTIKASAENNGRSMNAEIIQRLRISFDIDRDNVLRIPLDEETLYALETDAIVHDVRPVERATTLLESMYSGSSEYASRLLKVDELARENAYLAVRSSELEAKEDVDFILYYNKLLQINHIIGALTNENVSQQTTEMLEDLAHLNATEIATFRNRYAETLLQREKQKGWAEQSARLDDEISESEQEIARDTSDSPKTRDASR